MCTNHTFSGRRLVSTSSSARTSVRAGAVQARPTVAIKISVRTWCDRVSLHTRKVITRLPSLGLDVGQQ